MANLDVAELRAGERRAYVNLDDRAALPRQPARRLHRAQKGLLVAYDVVGAPQRRQGRARTAVLDHGRGVPDRGKRVAHLRLGHDVLGR